MVKPKFIVVTGGVLSGLGKGIATASIGNLLAGQLKVIPIKCDGYLNVDPGTMNPIEHGEVFVLDDGGEVDMDFGHYERFLDVSCKFRWNLTMGKVFEKIREKERRGDYLGKTVQYIPHVANLIKDWWKDVAAEEKADVALIEIGGTIGDIENEMYVEAARQLRKDVGDDSIMYAHLTYVPIPSSVNEQKSKPTQQSINLLRERGITPDLIICRCAEYVTDAIRKKIASFCDVDADAVITSIDVKSIYQIPLIFEEQNLVKLLNRKLKLDIKPNNVEWNKFVEKIENAEKNAKNKINIAICGKYTALEDSYASVVEALKHCGAHLDCKINIQWIETTDEDNIKEELRGVHGVIVPGGFGSRGVEGKIAAIKYCRENNIPFLGLCYGLQMAVIEFARDVCGLKGANSTEVDPGTRYPVIDILPEQKEITNKGGTMRLGAYPANIKPSTIVHKLYDDDIVSERHRHRYEVNPDYHKILEEKGLIFSGMSPNKRLVEFIELPKHRYFAATQAHPELKSSLIRPAPLFLGLVKAAKELSK